MSPRRAKAALVLGTAFLFTLVTFGNLTDYGTNFTFIRHVLMMDTIFPDATIRYRAIDSAGVAHLFYVLIILTEIVATALCWAGGVRMWRAAGEAGFAVARRPAVAGLTLASLLWQVGLLGLGGEWFGMWMSDKYNSVESAFRFSVITLGVLIFVSLPD